MKQQNLFFVLAAVCLLGGVLMIALHDQIDNIAASNAVSIAGYIIAIVGGGMFFYKVGKNNKDLNG